VPNQPSQPHKSHEFFYRKHGAVRADAELHEPILAEGDEDAAAEVSRRRLRAKGVKDEVIDRLIPRK
jgi:hypothetical protein